MIKSDTAQLAAQWLGGKWKQLEGAHKLPSIYGNNMQPIGRWKWRGGVKEAKEA